MSARTQSLLVSERLQKERRHERNKFMLIIFVCAVFAILIPVGFVRIPLWKIHGVEVVGTEVLAPEEIQTFVSERLQGNRLKLFPRATVLTYPRREILSSLEDAFPRAKNIKIDFEWKRRVLRVSLSEREPFALWCKSEEECFFLDSQAFLFDNAPLYSGPVFLTFAGEKYTEGRVPGSVLLDENDFRETMRVIDALQGMNFLPRVISLLSRSEYEVGLESGGVIRISRERSATSTMANLAALLEDPSLSLRNTQGGLSIEYIDLRFGNRVFYK